MYIELGVFLTVHNYKEQDVFLTVHNYKEPDVFLTVHNYIEPDVFLTVQNYKETGCFSDSSQLYRTGCFSDSAKLYRTENNMRQLQKGGGGLCGGERKVNRDRIEGNGWWQRLEQIVDSTLHKKEMVRIRAVDPHSFYADPVPDPAVFLKADRDPDPDSYPGLGPA